VTIEAGVLSLKITETGADEVNRKLTDIDRKAKAIGSKPINVPVASGALLDRQLEQLGKQVTLFNDGARFASTKAGSLKELGQVEQQLRGIIGGTNTSLEQRISAEKQLATLTGNAVTRTKSLTSVLGAQLGAYIGFQTAVRIYDSVTAAADRNEIAQRKLGAVARLTGTSLATVREISAEAASKFGITSTVASELTQGFVRLSSRSGDVAQTGGLMTAWLDLAASNGLTLDQAMQALTSTLGGQDEGLNRLGLMNPSQIWDKWATAVGGVKGQLTEQQKWMTIVMEVTTAATAVQGEYTKSLEGTLGKQQLMNTALEKMKIVMGENISPLRQLGYELVTMFANGFVWVTKFERGLGDAIGKLSIVQRMRKLEENLGIPKFLRGASSTGNLDKPLPELTLTSVLSPEALAAQLARPKGKAAPTAADLAAARKVEEKIAKALAIDLGNIPLADITAGDRIQKPGAVGVDKNGKMKGIAETVGKQMDAVGEVISEKQQMLMGLMSNVAGSIGNAFGDAFTAAFSGDKNFFAAFGESLLSSLGNILMQLGGQMIAYGAIIAPLASLLSFTPFGGLGMGAGASIAAGLAITALGAAMGAAGGGGSKGGGGGGGGGATAKAEPNEFAVAFDPDGKLRKSGPSVMPRASSISSAPMPEGRPVVQIGTINSLSPDDARWQRAVADTYNNARNRGLVRRG
jgi:hypothetical protein